MASTSFPAPAPATPMAPLATLLIVGGSLAVAAAFLFGRRPAYASVSPELEQWYRRADQLGARHRVKNTGTLRPGECLGTSGLVATRQGKVVAYWDGPMPPRLPWCANDGPILEYGTPLIRTKTAARKPRRAYG